MSAFTGDTGALITLLLIWLRGATAANEGTHVTVDNEGYILYCPCMGEFKGSKDF